MKHLTPTFTRFAFGFMAFAMGLFISISALANEHGSKNPSSNQDVEAQKHAGRDNNALFPQPKPNKALATRPSKPQLLEPVAYSQVESGKTVTLKWNSSEGADSYRVQIATDVNFKWLKVDEVLFKGTSYDFKDLEKGKTYFWRVSGLNPSNTSGYTIGEFSKSVFVVAQ